MNVVFVDTDVIIRASMEQLGSQALYSYDTDFDRRVRYPARGAVRDRKGAGLTDILGYDRDFDRVPGIRRVEP